MKTRVLCVDDEPRVLEGLELALRRAFDVTSAVGGDAGVRAVRENGPFAIVLSDMRMPGMDGASFLGRVREHSPHTVRMLLTGYADVDSAMRAVNEGQVYRFLTKPCPPATLLGAFRSAEEQWRLVMAERELLEKTLYGSIASLVDVLGLVQPLVFGRATRLKARVAALAEKVNAPDRWQIEVAAMLSQIGFVSLPPAVVDRIYRREPLGPEEKAMVERAPEVGEKLLAHIPRIDGVLDILRAYPKRFDDVRLAGKTHPLGARILKIVVDFDEVESTLGGSGGVAAVLRQRAGTYDPELLDAAQALFGAPQGPQAMEITVAKLAQGMVLAEDLRTTSGMLVVARGHAVTFGLLERIRNFHQRFVEPVKVWIEA